MWAVVAVIGMCLVKREEKHHIRYQFKSKRTPPPLERHCMCSSKLAVHHHRSEGETEVKTQQGKDPRYLTGSEWSFISCTFILTVHFSPCSHKLPKLSQRMGEISSSQITPTCNLFSAPKHSSSGNCLWVWWVVYLCLRNV